MDKQSCGECAHSKLEVGGNANELVCNPPLPTWFMGVKWRFVDAGAGVKCKAFKRREAGE